ncbi:MAG: class III signal peptide-containing protein [Candidatus Micrarchaeia archaeon]
MNVKRGQTAVEYLLLVSASVVFVSMVAYFVKQSTAG